MSTILSAWCDFCTHAQALALMALVPVLLYAWHTEMVAPYANHVADTGEMVVGSTDTLIRVITEKGLHSRDPLVLRSQEKGVRATDTPHRASDKGPRNVRTLHPAAMTGIRNSETPRLASVHIQESLNSDADELEGWAA